MNRMHLFGKFLLALLVIGVSVSPSKADVSARLSRGTLTLTGDSFNDKVQLSGVRGGTIVPNLISVSINEGPYVNYEGVANVRIDMRAGADVVIVGFIEISGNLEINTGGDLGDRSLVGLCNIGGNFSSRGSSEAAALLMGVSGNMTVKTDISFDVDGDGQTITIGAVEVGGNARVEGGRSADDDVIVTESTFRRDLNIILGGGNDVATVDTNRIGRALNADGGSGHDVLNRARLLIGLRNNAWRFEIITDVG